MRRAEEWGRGQMTGLETHVYTTGNVVGTADPEVSHTTLHCVVLTGGRYWALILPAVDGLLHPDKGSSKVGVLREGEKPRTGRRSPLQPSLGCCTKTTLKSFSFQNHPY